MKFSEQLLDALGEVGVDLVDLSEKQRFPKSFLRRTLPVAACAALMLGAGLYAWDYLQVEPAAPAAQTVQTLQQEQPAAAQAAKTELVLLSSQSSECDMTNARSQNVALACEAINGMVLQPGDEFSFNGAVGERTEEKGYVAASAYDDGGAGEVGGGIGQVASMLYCASLKLDLPQLERAGNTYAVSYVPLGFDAAVYWGVTDYRFYNALEIPIEIRARLEDGELTVELWGRTEQTWNIELKNELLGENVVETFRVYLDETGNIQREELIDVTRYESRE